MKLNETKSPAAACVILDSDYANVLNAMFFASESDAKRYAAAAGGRVVDERGLAEKYEAMHCAEGRQPNQSASGRFMETPEDASADWMEQHWSSEYAASAAEDFVDSTVWEISESDLSEV